MFILNHILPKISHSLNVLNTGPTPTVRQNVAAMLAELQLTIVPQDRTVTGDARWKEGGGAVKRDATKEMNADM